MKMGLCTAILAFILCLRKKIQKLSARRPSDEGCGNDHRLQWSPLLPNDVGRLAQYIGTGTKDNITHARPNGIH
jgi:hypothetical protein